MPFDVNGARQAGYSDAEIADHLAQANQFNIGKARQAGYSDAELLDHLVATDQARASVEGPKGPQGLRSGPPAPPDMSQVYDPVSGFSLQTLNNAGETVKNVASGLGRPIAKAITALPLTAMNAGIEARNLITNPRMPTLADINPLSARNNNPDMPSAQFNQFLDSVSRPPTTPGGKATEFVNSLIAGGMVPGPSSLSSLTPKPVIEAGDNAALAGQYSTTYRPQALNAQVLQNAQKEGYVAPPSSTNPSFMNRLMEGIGGKLRLNQEAGIANQSVTDRLAAEALKQNPDAPLTPGALQSVRNEAFQSGYMPLRNLGDIKTDEKFLTQLDAVTKTGRDAARSFPGLRAESPIDGVVASLKQPNFDSADGLDAIKYLRDTADTAYRAGNSALGKQYRTASKAIEDQIERDLVARGKDGQGLLSAFRDARKIIAQSHTAEDALNGESGQSSALKYAQALRNGKPLEGEQQKIAQFASAFPKANPNPRGENFPSISPLDAYGSGIASAASGSPAPFLFPLTRVGMRNYLLSPAGQARAMPNAMSQGAPAGLLDALVAGMKPTSPAMVPLMSRQAQDLFSQ